jgi:uncharacterized lipoprotein NlpE involved in copper resistance
MKLFGFVLVILCFFSCSSSKNFVHEHNAKLSLDYTGIYFGVTPCADCPGIETTLTLNNNFSYTLKLVYQERNVEPYVEKGYYKFDKTGNKITLYVDNKVSSKYFVGENYLIQLDLDGNFIESNLKDFLKLNKVNIGDNK